MDEKKYLLVEVMEREISTPELFHTFDDAHNKMCEYVAAVLDVAPEEIKESYLEGEEYDENTCVTEFTAWTEHHGNNFDWKIFTLNELGEFI